MAINPTSITSDDLNSKLTSLVNSIDTKELTKSLEVVSQKWKAYDLTEFGKGFGEVKGGFEGLTEATNNLTEQLAGQLDQNGFPCGGVNEATITRLTDTVKDAMPGFKTALTNHSAAIGNLISSAHALSVDSAAIDIHAVVPESFAVDIHDAGLLNDIVTDGSAEAIAAHYKSKGKVDPSTVKDLLGETAHADVKDIVDIAANDLADKKLPADIGLSIKLGGDQLSKALGGLDGGNLMKSAIESFTGGIGNAITSIAEGIELDLSAIPQINPNVDLKAGLGSAIAGVENVIGDIAATAGAAIGAVGGQPPINIGGASSAREIAEAAHASGLVNGVQPLSLSGIQLPGSLNISVPNIAGVLPGLNKLNKIDLTNLLIAGKNTDVANLLSSQIKIPEALKQQMLDVGESLNFKSPADVQGFIDRAGTVPGTDETQINEMKVRLKKLNDEVVNLDTCTTKTIRAGDQSNLMPVTDPGEYTTGDTTGKFPFLNSQEEVIRYLQSATREITTVIWHWSAHYTNSHHVGAEQIDAIHTRKGWSGIGYHFIIKRDGSLQVGRNINKTGAHVGGFNTRSIGISFIAGYKCASDKYSGVPPHHEVGKESITQAQQATMFRFMRAWYTVFPGGQAWGHADFPRNSGKVDPGFSVANYVYKSFGKRNVGDPKIDNKCLTASEIVSKTSFVPE